MHCVYFPPEVGGLESHVYHLCRALARRGHRVDIVTSRTRETAPVHEIMDGVGVWRTWFPMRNPTGWALHALGSMPRFGSLARSADLVHAQAFASVVPGMVVKRALGVPLVSTYHTSHFLRRASSPFWRPVFRRMIRAADHNLAASAEIARVAEEVAPGVRVEALVNGVDTELFRPVAPALEPPPPGRRRLVAARRLFPKNGVEYLVRALPALATRADVEAVLIGDGPERGRLEALARELGVAERTRFLGSRPHADMPGLVCSAELAIVPSLVEATSVAALEAMSCGVPVAASDVGGLPEIVDASVGALFRPGDPDDLARTVAALLQRPDLRALGLRARERVVARWSNERLAERHLEIYRTLLERRDRTTTMRTD
jgi:glycosyltransferase involved in cell wall biosynthesis